MSPLQNKICKSSSFDNQCSTIKSRTSSAVLPLTTLLRPTQTTVAGSPCWMEAANSPATVGSASSGKRHHTLHHQYQSQRQQQAPSLALWGPLLFMEEPAWFRSNSLTFFFLSLFLFFFFSFLSFCFMCLSDFCS